MPCALLSSSLSISVALHCGVAGATQQQAAELRRRYHANTHPALTELTAIHGDGSFEPIGDGVPLHVAASETISLHAAWADCPDETPCEGAERYARFDRDVAAVVSARESLRISWLGTIGHWNEPRTGRASDDPATTTDGTWHAPDASQSGALFVVLRDDREGVSWTQINVIVD